MAACVAPAHAEERGWRDHNVRPHEFREREFHDQRFFDSRYHHDHYYPPRGFVFGVLPPRFNIVVFGGSRFYFAGGVWYSPEGPGRFVVVVPPVGVVAPILPPDSTTIWVGSTPYYYANGVYYAQSPQGYTVVTPPPGNVVTVPPPAAISPPASADAAPAGAVAQAPLSSQIFVYPRQGQNEQQQAADRLECERWAAGQTGFDPNVRGITASVQKQHDYSRAMDACLDGRGYTVK
ncbi:MAG: DUF6515 family protein [Betaproteobacteria bacterium]